MTQAVSKKKSSPDLNALGALALLGVNALGAQGASTSWNGLKNGLRGAVAKDPLDALAVTVLGGAVAFYRAERGHNPKVNNLFDAICFISTCLSVGYDQTFAMTKTGKAIASAVMTIGPAMSAKALDPPGDKEDPVVGKLDEILQALKK
ncbi:MAG: ion channel [Polyangiales bacterium]